MTSWKRYSVKENGKPKLVSNVIISSKRNIGNMFPNVICNDEHFSNTLDSGI